jgi:hypothetical protein
MMIDSQTLYPEISREVTAGAKKARNDQLFLETAAFQRVTSEGRKNSFKTHTKSHMKLYLLTAEFRCLAYMHYIGDSYPASFDSACREHTYSKIFHLGKKSTLAITNGMKTSNKPN